MLMSSGATREISLSERSPGHADENVYQVADKPEVLLTLLVPVIPTIRKMPGGRGDLQDL